jgi:hypothetical protein
MRFLLKILSLGFLVSYFGGCGCHNNSTDDVAVVSYEVYNQTLPFVHDTCGVFCFPVSFDTPAAYPPTSRLRHDSTLVAQSIQRKRLTQDFDLVLTYDSLFIETAASFAELIKNGSLFSTFPGIPRTFYESLVKMATPSVRPPHWQASSLSIPKGLHLLPHGKETPFKKPTIWLGTFKLSRIGIDSKNGKACYVYSLNGEVFREKLLLLEKRANKWVVVKEILTGMS